MSATLADIIQRLDQLGLGSSFAASPSAGGDVAGSHAASVSSITHDSRQVRAGGLFCCVPGEQHDGHDYAAGAVSAGATALLVERRLDLDVNQIIVADVRVAMGPVSSVIHGDPSASVDVIGVTGTNGKTSVVHLLGHLFDRLGQRTRTMGTLSGARTTPEAPDLQQALAEDVEARTEAVAMEVSSHALSLHRVDGTSFRAAVFTNLGHDHLDFHHTMEEYFDAKALLFDRSFTPTAIVNRDDPWGQQLIDRLEQMGANAPELISFGLDDVDELAIAGPESRFRWDGHDVVLRLAGAHNVSNALAAAAVAKHLGHDPVDIADALCAAGAPRGRFEFVNVGQPFHVIVDYAHKPEALSAVLESARQVAGSHQTHVVIGCGGDRDAEKRPMMAAAAVAGADRVILTSDNPRTEDPHAIIDDMLAGLSDGDPVDVVVDRQAAINAAVSGAAPGDVVLIAGKGHEDYQEVHGEKRPFDDRLVAIEAITTIDHATPAEGEDGSA